MKKLVALILMLGLLGAMGSSAYALEQAGGLIEWARLERYASFTQEDTVWSVRSNQTEAALSRMTLSQAPYNGYVCFGLELTGDRETGVVVPVLAFYYDGEAALHAEAISMVMDGVRYDFAVGYEEIAVGTKRVERMSVALDEEGVNVIRALPEVQSVQIALLGNVVIEVDAALKENYVNTRDELAGRSLEAVRGMLREFEAVESYSLWDLNEAWWMLHVGVKPEMKQLTVGTADTGEITLRAPMYMLWRGHYGKNVRELQQLLIDNGYLQGRVDGIYGDHTVQAVRSAQKWLGLIPTGCADEVLIRLLQGGGGYGLMEDAQEHEADVRTAEGVCALSVDRFWFADAVESTGGDRRSVLDKDDTMIIYDGMIRNLSKSNLDFYWQVSAVVRCGEYEYPCVVACERNEGMSLASILPPLGEARLLIYAEIPENIAGQGAWTLEISAGESKFLFE